MANIEPFKLKKRDLTEHSMKLSRFKLAIAKQPVVGEKKLSPGPAK
jgi:hypothetical protein